MAEIAVMGVTEHFAIHRGWIRVQLTILQCCRQLAAPYGLHMSRRQDLSQLTVGNNSIGSSANARDEVDIAE
jgi:hypothetical protein